VSELSPALRCDRMRASVNWSGTWVVGRLAGRTTCRPFGSLTR
jgi:hypothetical protein